MRVKRDRTVRGGDGWPVPMLVVNLAPSLIPAFTAGVVAGQSAAGESSCPYGPGIERGMWLDGYWAGSKGPAEVYVRALSD